MKSFKFFLLFAASVANHFAHCKYLTVDVSISEPYGGINVTRHDIAPDAYSLIYSVENPEDDIGKIVDGPLVLVRNNKLIGKSLVVLHRDNRKLLEYQRAPWFDIIGIMPYDVFWKKENNVWKRVSRAQFENYWDVSRYRIADVNLLQDKFIAGSSVVEDEAVRWDVVANVVARAISYGKQQLWTLHENAQARFVHAYQFKDSGFEFLVLVFREAPDSDALYHKALVKGVSSWLVAPSNMDAHVIERAKQLPLWMDANV